MSTNGQLSWLIILKPLLFLYHDNLQMYLRFMFFRDKLNVKFSDKNACSSAKVVDPIAFQNTQTKDEKVMMNFYIIDYISSISEEDNYSIQTFIMYSTCQS